MNTKIKILHLEDSEFDATIVAYELKKSNFPFEILWVTNEVDFDQALNEFSPDIILSDHSLPAFSSIQALQMIKDREIAIPFILITGTVSEEFAVSIIQQGASDYLLKDRLQRLPDAIQNAIRNQKAEIEKRAYYEEITRNENKFRALIEYISDGIILVNEYAEVVYQSPSEERITGFTPEEMQDKSIFDFVYAEDLPDALEFFKTVSMQPGVSKRKQYRIKHKQGHFIWVETIISNHLSDDHIKGFIINYRDISEQKTSEEETLKLVENLQKKNKDLQQFAYIVSHNLRSPIVKIQGLVNLLQDSETVEETNTMLNSYIANEVNNLDQVVIDMNAIITAGDADSQAKEDVNFEQVSKLVKEVLQPLIIQNKADISCHFSDTPHVFSVKSYIYSILFNLMSNAIKYRSQERPLCISLKTFREPPFICLSVQDNGMGIDLDKYKNQVFGLYKRFGNTNIPGRGLGLNMVKTQIESLGGKIEVESKPNSGSTFTIYIPELKTQ